MLSGNWWRVEPGTSGMWTSTPDFHQVSDLEKEEEEEEEEEDGPPELASESESEKEDTEFLKLKDDKVSQPGRIWSTNKDNKVSQPGRKVPRQKWKKFNEWESAEPQRTRALSWERK